MNTSEAVVRMFAESGVELPKSYFVVINGAWGEKQGFRSLKKACEHIDHLGRKVNWQLWGGKDGLLVADRDSLFNWFRGEY